MHYTGRIVGLGAIMAAAALPQPAAAQAVERPFYDLPRQALSETLQAIARISGDELLFDAEAVAGKQAPALRGNFTAEEAVQAVLVRSGLSFERRGGAVLVRSIVGGGQSTGPAVPASAEGQDIVVTGTRIRGGVGSAPVITATRQRIEEAGLADLAGFARTVPQNFTGGQNPGVAGGGDQGGQNNINNSTTLNLRGLGPDATLTLINGHRIANDALNQGVDISAIPLAAIERVEIIADGASALYGSDAVGGVANIILRRDYDGAELSTRFGAATQGGGEQQHYSAVGGGRWSSGGIMAALDYNRSTPILARDRDYTSSIDGSQTLIASQQQASAVIAGHQALATGLSVELDAQFTHRTSQKANAFFATSDALTNGLVNQPEVTAWSTTPTVRIDLPARWRGAVSATRGVARTDIHSRRIVGGIETPQRLIYENRVTALEATAEGPLFALPGGDARLAIGAGLRTTLLDVNVTATTGGVTRTTRDFTETRTGKFAFGELSVPLVGSQNALPLIAQLRLSAALRYERYDGIDEVATPKFGVIYRPHPDLELRGSWGRSFKLPTLSQLNQARAGSLYAGTFFVPQPTPSLPVGATVLYLSGGSPDLRAERARTWNLSAEWRPRFADGLRLEASWFDVDYRDRIASPIGSIASSLVDPVFRDLVVFNPTSEQVADFIASLPLGLVNQSGQPFDAAQVAAIVDGGLRNAAQERVRGIDLAADYDIALGGAERLRLDAAASYLKSDRRLGADQPLVVRAGRLFNPPHWRGRMGGTWRRDNVGLTGALNYVGGTIDDNLVDIVRVDPFVTLDLSAVVRTSAPRGLFHDLEIRLSALNLLGEQPDSIRTSDPAGIPFDSTNQSPVGRFVSLSLTKSW